MITVNGDEIEYETDMTVTRVLEVKKYVFPLLIVQVDGTFVPREDYDTTIVVDGAKVEVIHLMSGG